MSIIIISYLQKTFYSTDLRADSIRYQKCRGWWIDTLYVILGEGRMAMPQGVSPN